jgi:hypothetical protein
VTTEMLLHRVAAGSGAPFDASDEVPATAGVAPARAGALPARPAGAPSPEPATMAMPAVKAPGRLDPGQRA